MVKASVDVFCRPRSFKGLLRAPPIAANTADLVECISALSASNIDIQPSFGGKSFTLRVAKVTYHASQRNPDDAYVSAQVVRAAPGTKDTEHTLMFFRKYASGYFNFLPPASQTRGQEEPAEPSQCVFETIACYENLVSFDSSLRPRHPAVATFVFLGPLRPSLLEVGIMALSIGQAHWRHTPESACIPYAVALYDALVWTFPSEVPSLAGLCALSNSELGGIFKEFKQNRQFVRDKKPFPKIVTEFNQYRLKHKPAHRALKEFAQTEQDKEQWRDSDTLDGGSDVDYREKCALNLDFPFLRRNL